MLRTPTCTTPASIASDTASHEHKIAWEKTTRTRSIFLEKKGYSHSQHTTQLLCVHCRCRASRHWQSTTRWLPTVGDITRDITNRLKPNILTCGIIWWWQEADHIWKNYYELTVSLATEKSRSPSLLYLIWVMDLSWPWSRIGFCGEERTPALHMQKKKKSSTVT